MSKYTTEVRFICENACGLSSSEGEASVNDIVAGARSKIFNFPYPIFDESYKSVLETKILKHFYTREIGFETTGLWKLKLDTKMNEIMPYYNLLYTSSLLEFNPLYTKDLTREKDNTITKEDKLTEENAGTLTSTKTTNADGTTQEYSSNSGSGSTTFSGASNESGTSGVDTTNIDLYSDTPQGALTGVENETYLTNARKITNESDSEYEVNKTDNTSETNETSSSGNSTVTTNNDIGEDVTTNTSNATIQNKDGSTVEDYLEHVYGYENGSASKLIKEYRETFLNIDMMVINDLEELFLQLW